MNASPRPLLPNPHPLAHPPAHAQITRAILLAGCVCAALLALAACGVTPSVSAGSAQHTNPGAPYNPRATVRPCSGPYASATAVTPALVLTLQTAEQAGSAHVGQVAQVQLPISHQWSLIAVPNGLQLVGQAAQQDAQRNVCFWDFQVRAAGTYVIGFIGVTQCDVKPGACQQSTETQRFTLKAS